MSAALKKLGDRLREARLAAGISQAQLGAPYFTRAHVSAIELGKIRPAMRSLEHMARKLDKPASYFLDDADAERARKEHELEVGSRSEERRVGKECKRWLGRALCIKENTRKE